MVAPFAKFTMKKQIVLKSKKDQLISAIDINRH